MQFALVQSSPDVQTSPSGFFSVPLGTQLFVAPQTYPVAQSMSLAHAVRHAFPAESQRYTPQVLDEPVAQVPAPSHSFPLTLPSAHVESPHAVPDFASVRQAPSPSHMPSALQLEGKPASGAQRERGSVSTATLPQAPSLPLPFNAAVHASQGPPQLELQQTPSTQLPLPHCEPALHAFPFPSFAIQTPPLQNAVATQSAADAQLVRQAVAEALHVYGSQAIDADALQVPEPSQREPETMPPEHVVAAQGVEGFANVRHAPAPSQAPSALHETG
ncbi:MAG: hypothetical protein ACXVEF_41505 [Polyangiales bacterium]